MKFRFENPTRLLTVLILLLSLMVARPVRAAVEDDVYIGIFSQICDGDKYSENGDSEQALAKYKQAQAGLLGLQRTNASWNVRLVNYRLNYLEEKINPPKAMAGVAGAKGGMVDASLPQVKLIEAGAEPRKVMRLQPKAGDKQTLEMTIKMGMDMDIGGMPIPSVKVPEIKLGLETTVGTISGEGDIDYTVVIGNVTMAEDPDANPQTVDAVKAGVDGLKGTTAKGIVSTRGFSKAMEVKVSEGATPQVRHSLDQLQDTMANIPVPLPEEAIGVGAKWEVKQKVKSQGMKIDQTANFELVTVEGGQIGLKLSFDQSAANQKVQNPAMAGVKVSVVKLTGNGTGQSTLDLGQLMPIVARVESHSQSAMMVNAAGNNQDMNMKSDTVIGLETK